jgi:NADPH-dependent F420 reductase
MGRGLAIRLALKHDILIGSRSLDKAQKIAKERQDVARGFYQDDIQGSFQGVLNSTAMKMSDVVIVSLPSKAIVPTLTELEEYLNPKQTIVSNVVPMIKKGKLFHYSPLSNGDKCHYSGKSAAEVIQTIVKPIPVVCAFQTVPAAYLNNCDSILNIDVLIASNDDAAIDLVSRLILDIPNLRPLNVGPLDNSRFIESLTPLLLNASILNNLQTPSIRVVPWWPTSFKK